ncbi:MAG: hypothetical protein FWE61_08375 [Micrococcales bacterium]|nr:hypothetical protein [Micrococcales bacterium]
MADYSDPDVAARAVADPTTSAADLALVAHQHASLRVEVAAHRNTYPGLLDWLETFGKPDVAAAVAARRERDAEAALPPPPPPPEPAAEVPVAPSSGAPAVVTVASDLPTAVTVASAGPPTGVTAVVGGPAGPRAGLPGGVGLPGPSQSGPVLVGDAGTQAIAGPVTGPTYVQVAPMPGMVSTGPVPMGPVPQHAPPWPDAPVRPLLGATWPAPLAAAVPLALVCVVLVLSAVVMALR